MDLGLSVSGIAIVIVMILLTCVLWKVTKLLLIPIQILLFLVLMVIAYKLVFAPEKLEVIQEKVTNEKIQALVGKASDSAVRFVKDKAIQAAGVQKTTESAPAAPAPADSGAAASGDKAQNGAAPQKEAAPAEKVTEAVRPQDQPAR